MTGHLHLVFAAKDGRTFLSEQSFRAPMHLSKPYWDGGHLIVNAVNPTAGLFAGDVIDVTVRSTAGARGVFTSPSASRVFRARPRAPAAVVRQLFAVEDGGWLDVIPEMLIPQAGARFSQETTFAVAAGGEAMFLESVAPGRVASGEAFRFECLDWRTQLRLAGRLVALERHRLAPDDDSLHPLRAFFPASYHAAGYVVSPRLPAGRAPLAAIAALETAGARLAASAVAEGALAFKILAGDSGSLRHAIARFRALILAMLKAPAPNLRKL